MRSPFAILAAVLLSACAVGAGGEGEGPGDAATHHDSAPFASPDAASQPDEGTATFDDAGTTPTVDAGNNNTSGCSFTGVLATFDFTGQPGNQTSTSAKTAQGVTATAFTRSTSLTATSGLDSINSTNWATSTSIDKSRYYTFTITPSGSCALDLTSISLGSKSSTTGPANAAVATSDDQFAATTTFVPGATGALKLSVTGATSAVEVRIYGYGASSAAGTMRVGATLTISGALN